MIFRAGVFTREMDYCKCVQYIRGVCGNTGERVNSAEDATSNACSRGDWHRRCLSHVRTATKLCIGTTMPRKARLDIADTIYHITCRGDRREPIYRDEVDRRNWLRILGEVCKQHRWRVYAFCQMGNHYHLVAKPLQATLSIGMHSLNSGYTQRFNARHMESGHVFQGRFHSEVVHRQAHLLELMRYVVLNPIRAGMVATPAGWPWSSYWMTCDAALAPSWLDTQWVLAQFSDNHTAAVAAYRRFVADGCGGMGQAPNGASPPAADAADTAGGSTV